MTELFKRDTGFTQVSNKIITSTDLSCKAKAVYCYLFSRPDGWKFYRSEITKNFKESTKTIDSALKELEDFGVIQKEQLRDDKGFYSGFNIILNTDTQESDNRLSDTPKTDNRESDNRKGNTINTDTSNTDLSNTDTNNNIVQNDDLITEKEHLFNIFYTQYPRKQAKEPAKKAFLKLTKEEMEKAIYTVGIYPFSRNKQYIPLPASWLNAKRFNDEFDAAKPAFTQFANDEVPF